MYVYIYICNGFCYNRLHIAFSKMSATAEETKRLFSETCRSPATFASACVVGLAA